MKSTLMSEDVTRISLTLYLTKEGLWRVFFIKKIGADTTSSEFQNSFSKKENGCQKSRQYSTILKDIRTRMKNHFLVKSGAM